MTQLDNTAFNVQTATLFPTNGVGGITAADLRTQMNNLSDSVVFMRSGNITPPTADDDDASTAGNGVFQPGHVWVDETGQKAYMCLDNSTNAAVWIELTYRGRSEIVVVNTSRDLALTDTLNILEIDAGSGAVELTIPDNSTVEFPVGTKIEMTLLDAGNTATLTASAGVDLNGVTAGSGDFSGNAYDTVTLYKRDTDAWVVKGNIGAIA
jgi:hypothetical protein